MGSGLAIAPAENHGRRRWKVEIREGGRRRRLFFPTRIEAEAFVESRQAERDRYGAFLAELPAGDRVRLIDALERLDRIGLTLEQAVDLAEKHRAAHPIAPAPRVGAAVVQMLEAKAVAGRRARYTRQLTWSTRHFMRAFEGRSIDQVAQTEIEAWLLQHDWAPATRRSVIGDLRTLFAFAQRRGWMLHNPAAGIEKPALEPAAPCIFTPGDAGKLLISAVTIEPAAVAPLAIGLFAGLRPSEIERLTWAEISAGHIEVKAAKAKTRRRRLVTVQPNLAAWLASCPCAGDFVQPHNWTRRWRRVVRHAGVIWGHDILRHSFASYHLAQWRSPDRTAFELGHGNTQMLFAHYRELVTPAAAAEYWSIAPAQ